jgi:hypothetical protein
VFFRPLVVQGIGRALAGLAPVCCIENPPTLSTDAFVSLFYDALLYYLQTASRRVYAGARTAYLSVTG